MSSVSVLIRVLIFLLFSLFSFVLSFVFSPFVFFQKQSNWLKNCKNFVSYKVLFTNHYTWQNSRLRLLRLVNRLLAVIHKAQKSKKKVLPFVTVGD